MKKLLSVVVPVRDERAVLPLFWTRLRGVRASLRRRWLVQVIFVDDASRDGSGAWLDTLARQDCGVVVVHTDVALGQQRALLVGLAQALGDAVVSLDADLQDPPEVIADMATLWQQGADVVYGVRGARPSDSVGKRLSAAVFYRLLSLLSSHRFPADAGDFRLMDRRVVEAVCDMPQRRPYVRGMAACAGTRPVACTYTRAPRRAGSSSYDLWAMGQLAWAGVFSFAAPWRFAVAVAALTAAATAFGIRQCCGGAGHWLLACAGVGLACGAGLAAAQRCSGGGCAAPQPPGCLPRQVAPG